MNAAAAEKTASQAVMADQLAVDDASNMGASQFRVEMDEINFDQDNLYKRAELMTGVAAACMLRQTLEGSFSAVSKPIVASK